MRLVVVSGRSGSGKTIALNALEYLGFYCIDNLPVILLKKIPTSLNYENLAVSIDARNIEKNTEIKNIIESFNCKTEVIYTDATDETLLKRFNSIRRKHPLTNTNISLEKAISLENELLQDLQHLSNLTIDTTNLSIYNLKNIIQEHINNPQEKKIQIFFQSFGFKYGPPTADFIFDVRCLPNPYWIKELKNLNGKSKEVQSYLFEHEETKEIIRDITNFLSKWISHYELSNRYYLNIAIGCTGGFHRSVCVSEELFKHFNKNYPAQINHRNLSSH